MLIILLIISKHVFWELERLKPSATFF